MDCFGYLGLGSSIISICISFFHVLVTCDRKTAFERERRPDTVSAHSVLALGLPVHSSAIGSPA